jgi:HEXXH motif-containing protein
MMISGFRFEPDAAHAARCVRHAHTALAESLRHILEQSRGDLSVDEEAIRRLMGRLEAGERFPPSTFALYYDLVPALLMGEQQRAEALFRALAQEQPILEPMRLVPLGDPKISPGAERYIRFMNSEGPMKHTFRPPRAAVVDSFVQRFPGTMELLQRAVPEFVEEVRAQISEIVLLVVADDAKMKFEAGSSYRLPGAMFVNAASRKTRIEIIETLAHENAHSRLFGLCTEEAAVRNDDGELYPSPLRVDPRPMDGVYHATFVSARMHWTMSRIIDSGLLATEELVDAEHSRAHDRRSFESGYETVARHGRLTETGHKAMEAAVGYMRAAA